MPLYPAFVDKSAGKWENRGRRTPSQALRASSPPHGGEPRLPRAIYLPCLALKCADPPRVLLPCLARKCADLPRVIYLPCLAPVRGRGFERLENSPVDCFQ